MGGRAIIGGTAHDIKPGKALINGTGYNIKLGKTMIGGTGYNINFSKLPVGTLLEFTKIGDTEWVCPESGNYEIRLHGSGGNASYTSQASEHSQNDVFPDVWSCRGSTSITFGGGSGQKETKYLIEGHVYRIHIPGDENDADYTSDGIPLEKLGATGSVVWPNKDTEYKGALLSYSLEKDSPMTGYLDSWHYVTTKSIGHHNFGNAYKAGKATITDITAQSEIMSCDGATGKTHSGNIASDGGQCSFSWYEDHYMTNTGYGSEYWRVYWYNYIYNCYPINEDPLIGWGDIENKKSRYCGCGSFALPENQGYDLMNGARIAGVQGGCFMTFLGK